MISEVGSGNKAQAADEGGAEIGQDIAVEIFHEQHVVLVGVHHQLHAGIVHDVLAVGNLGILFGDIARAAQEQAVRKLHDVGLVDGVNLLALVLARILERELGDAGGSLFRDDFQALDYAWNHFMLDAGIQTFGILAHDDQVDIGIACRNVRQIPDRAKVGVELEHFAEFDVDAGEPAADRSRHRTLQSNVRALDGGDEFLRNVLVVLLVGLSAGFEALRIKFDAGSFKNANCGVGDFGSDAIAGDERYFVSHDLIYELKNFRIDEFNRKTEFVNSAILKV